MSWLTPLGFLGLVGLVALLIIYLIKPNYQNKFISSTFVWRLSLKYKKKKIPLSKLRNILLIICQVLIITACAAILAQPFIDGEDSDASKEKVIVIDASASMLAELEDETRFERAVSAASKYATEVLEDGGLVSVILAGRESRYLVQRAGQDSAVAVSEAFSSLVDENGGTVCTYGNADVDGAMLLAEEVLADNPRAEVVFYTGTTYIDDGRVTVKTEEVTDSAEWNAAILDVRAILDDNYYRFEVDAASYGRPTSLKIQLEISGAHGSLGSGDSGESFNGGTVKLEFDALLEMNKVTTLRFGQDEKDDVSDLKLYAYDQVYCHVEEQDSLEIDNSFHLYGGTPQVLKIQYYSTKSNNFVSGALIGLRNLLRADWDIEIDEIQDSEEMVNMGMGKEPELEGYDIYIFEHHMPKALPTDGLVILIDPDQVPKGTDFVLGNSMGFYGEHELEAGDSHEIMDFVNPAEITVTQYRKINTYDSGYTPLMYVDGNPIVIAKNEPQSKVLLFSFSFHYSNIVLTPAFPIMMSNVINHYIPTTLEDNVFEIYDEVTINSRSEKLTVTGPADLNASFTEFPASIKADAPGPYTVTQTPISGQQVVENFYVTIPAEQSNIVREVDSLTNPYFPPAEEESDIDLVFYFAIAMVALLFCEWWLKSREQN